MALSKFEGMNEVYVQRLKRSQCDGKKQYVTKSFAKKIIKMAHANDQQKMCAYRCDFCGYVHIGHREPGGRSIVFEPVIDLSDASDLELLEALSEPDPDVLADHELLDLMDDAGQ